MAKTTFLPLLLSSLFFLGCTGDIVELSAHDGSASTHDLGPIDNDGGGGGPVDMAGVVQNPTFTADVEPVLINHGCNAAGACHGNGTQVPVLTTDVNANYASIKAEAMKGGAGASSMLLTHLLPGAGHTGSNLFSGTTDPLYQTWLNWINAGEPL